MVNDLGISWTWPRKHDLLIFVTWNVLILWQDGRRNQFYMLWLSGSSDDYDDIWRLETVMDGDGWWWMVMDGDGWPSHLASSWEMMLGRWAKAQQRLTKAWRIAAMRCFSSHFSWCQAFAALAFGICRGVVWHSFNCNICTWHGSGSTMFYVSGSVAARLATIWTMEKKTAWLWVAFRVCVCVKHL